MRSIKLLYDELSGIKASTLNLNSAELDDIDAIQKDQVKTVYQQYIKIRSAKDRDFIDFIRYLYPSLSAADLGRIREGI